MNRAERRKCKLHLPEERARDEMRDIFIATGKFMLNVNDHAMMRATMKKYFKYCRNVNPVTVGIFEALEEMRKWRDECKAAYEVAIAEGIGW